MQVARIGHSTNVTGTDFDRNRDMPSHPMVARYDRLQEFRQLEHIAHSSFYFSSTYLILPSHGRTFNGTIHKRHHYYYREKSIRSFLPSNQLHSVLESDVPEEVAHALLVVDPPDALRQQDRDVHSLF